MVPCVNYDWVVLCLCALLWARVPNYTRGTASQLRSILEGGAGGLELPPYIFHGSSGLRFPSRLKVQTEVKTFA